jgi:hypothetical protein
MFDVALSIIAAVVSKASVGGLIYYNKKLKTGEKFDLNTFGFGLIGAGIFGAIFGILGMDVESNLTLIMASSVVLENVGSNIYKIITQYVGKKVE